MPSPRGGEQAPDLLDDLFDDQGLSPVPDLPEWHQGGESFIDQTPRTSRQPYWFDAGVHSVGDLQAAELLYPASMGAPDDLGKWFWDRWDWWAASTWHAREQALKTRATSLLYSWARLLGEAKRNGKAQLVLQILDAPRGLRAYRTWFDALRGMSLSSVAANVAGLETSLTGWVAEYEKQRAQVQGAGIATKTAPVDTLTATEPTALDQALRAAGKVFRPVGMGLGLVLALGLLWMFARKR